MSAIAHNWSYFTKFKQKFWSILWYGAPLRCLRKFRLTNYTYTAFSHLLQYHSVILQATSLWAVWQLYYRHSEASYTPRRNLKTVFSLRKCIISFPSTLYVGEICKRRFHSEIASNVFRPHYTSEKFVNGGFTLKLHQMFSVHTIPALYVREIYNDQRSIWICVWWKLGQGNHVIFVTSSFSKSSVFKSFSVHTRRNVKPAF